MVDSPDCVEARYSLIFLLAIQISLIGQFINMALTTGTIGIILLKIDLSTVMLQYLGKLM